MRTSLIVLFGSLTLAAVGCGGADGPVVGADTVDPPTGSQLGGQRVTIAGEGFINGGATPNHVLFGDLLASTVNVVSDVELEVFTPPALGEGTVDVTVFNSNGFTVLEGGYEYNAQPVVTSVTPDTGNQVGGDTLTIAGSGFEDNEAGDPVVVFGGVEIFDFTVVSDTQIDLTSPGGVPLQSADVVVSNANGTGALDKGFQFIANGLIAATGGGGQCGQSNNSQLLFIDLDTGEVFELSVSDGGPITGLAALDDGRVIAMGGGLCCNVPRPIFEVDIFTGERKEIGFTKRSSDISTDGTTVFSMDRFGDASYGTLDLDDATYNRIGGNTLSFGGLAIADDGTHFHISGQNMRTVNPADGVESDPAVTVTGIGSPSSMAFHRGNLYTLDNNSLCFGGGVNEQSVFEIDPATGVAEVVAGTQLRVDALESADKLIGN